MRTARNIFFPACTRIFVFLILGIIFALLTRANQQKESPLTQPEQTILLDHIREEVGAPGGILGLSAGDSDFTIVASGFSDREKKTAMTPEMPYQLGSISKTYTAVTTLRLIEDGRLDLNDTIDHFFPSFPDGAKITVAHLLGQTSGLKDFYLYLYFRPDREEMIRLVTRKWTKEELLELSGKFGRWFAPGTDWDYSSTNYFLLGAIIERVTRKSLPQAYHDFIYEPLKINGTWLILHEPAKGALPTGYMGHVEGWKHSEMFGELGPTTVLDQSPVEWGAGGLAAPAKDCILFFQGLFEGKLLKEETLHRMMQFRPIPPLGVADPKLQAGTSDGYGLGLVKLERQGFILIGHGGLFTGHTAGLWYIPKRNLTITLYFNRGFINQRSVLDQVISAIDLNSK